MAQAGSLTEMDTKQSVRDALLVKTQNRSQKPKAPQDAILQQHVRLENFYFGGDNYGYKPNTENDSQ
jgi:hypothetical protein